MNTARTDITMRTDIWREGPWVDLWSVVHMFSGLLIGLFFYFLGIGAITGIIVAVIALSAYELFEILAKIKESPMNRLMDVMVGMVGYVPAFFLVTTVISGPYLILTFGLLFLLTIAMSVVGWRASQKAAEFEKRFRAKLASSHSRLTERGLRFRAVYRERKNNSAVIGYPREAGWQNRTYTPNLSKPRPIPS